MGKYGIMCWNHFHNFEVMKTLGAREFILGTATEDGVVYLTSDKWVWWYVQSNVSG